MGSFAELVMSFPLREDVGPDVLGAFSSIAVPSQGAPALPQPAGADGDWWELDDFECDMKDPWTHDWGAWLGASYTNISFGSDQGASMVWRRTQWFITARATWKSTPEAFVPNLAVLGSVIDASQAQHYSDYVGAGDRQTGLFVGYTRHEYEPRPWLLWADGSTLRAENLNPPNFSL